MHGKKAKDGVVIITSKDDDETKIKIGKAIYSTGSSATFKSDVKSKIRIKTDSDKDPLYILDGNWNLNKQLNIKKCVIETSNRIKTNFGFPSVNEKV